MEAAVIMSTVLLLLAAVMGSARRNAQAVSGQARQYAAEEAVEDRFTPRDLIRLCQFIEVWIPPK